jgi:two-component system CheB/CheR fusion protein
MNVINNQIDILPPFPVVGIGASAGGLDAFKKLISAIPTTSGMAYIIVQHLSPDHPSSLADLLVPHSNIPVIEIINIIDLKPDHIYIVPVNNNIVANNNQLELKLRTRGESRSNIIDIFFESLAKVHKTYAIGIILSGTAFDGTAGFKILKEFGGATIAQDPETAAFKAMPQSAIDADVVDYILAPESIPVQLLEIQKSYIVNHAYSDEDHIPKNEEEILYHIINLVFLRTGNDFRQYKQPTLRRRIARRMVVVQRHSIEDYYNYLRNNKEEQDLLFNDFLIPVTYFFRDPAFFDSLGTNAYPLLIKNITNNTIRIWVAGCSTGEEAYSLAISLHEYLLQTNTNAKVQIFASDISEKCITKARAAVYSSQDVQEISKERLHTYFTKRDGQYHINKVLRDMCVFATHNFINDPPFAKIDLVSCRNVMIYFNPQLQSKVLSSFHFSLKQNGLLFLGKSETVSNAQNLYEVIGKNEKIYLRRYAPSRYVPNAFNPSLNNIKEKIKASEINGTIETDIKKTTTEVLLNHFTPSSVVINKNMEILHFHGDIRPYLTPSPGKPDFNILKMAPGSLSFELQNAIIQVKKEKRKIHKENIHIAGMPYSIAFEILALQNDYQHLLVLFYKKDLPSLDNISPNGKSTDQLRIAELENELAQMREDAKRVSEEQQTALEELQTTSEELLSSNEELQALNEELETSTEELQSNNEELMCVNDELLDRQEQLISTRNYAESIIQTIREPLIIIKKDFTIKSANPSFYKYFNTNENDTENHSFFEIGDCHWNIPELKDKILKTLDNQTIIKDFRLDIVCKGIGKKTILVNARKIINSKPEGMILLALEDITDLVTSNELLNAKNNELLKYNEQLEYFSSAASHDLQEPIRKIQMFCKRLLEHEESLSDTGRHTVERVIFIASNMSTLIADLIHYSRINLVENELKKTDLNLIIKKTLHELKDQIIDYKPTITVSTLPAIKAVPFQMQQLFNNLISNSLKYSREGITSEIKIEAGEANEDEILELGGAPEIKYMKIGLEDNGIGFAQEFSMRIFDPFYRLHNVDQYSGSGLGLTLVKKIVDNHHGFIKASSEINSGTKITIYIPEE